jgi:nitrate reductase alpha subunit
VTAALTNFTRVLAAGESAGPPHEQAGQSIPQALRDEWGDSVVWDERTSRPVALTRDMVGSHFDRANLSPALVGEREVTLADGTRVRARPVFDLIKSYVDESFTPEATEAVTWAPRSAIETLARAVAEARGRTFMATGMGPNQFFNNDLKDRTIFLLAALTGNLGRIAGNVGSYAGNYRVALFNGMPQYIAEDPFDIELDLDRPARVKQKWVAESAHYYNHEDHPLRFGDRLLTGSTHMPTPTKTLWFANANSILGNLKWHYNTVENVLPKIEMIAVNEWWWSTSCEYADVVFPADSWAELKHPDMTASVTNPFLTMFPATPLPRIHDTKGDIEIIAAVGTKLGEITGDRRFVDYFAFVGERRVAGHLQRILDRSTTTRGYRADDLLRLAERGIPALMMTRTSPRCGGYEQTEDSRPWYTKTGRAEFYREEREFVDAGENLPVHREPIDSTFHEPNVILAAPHPAIRPLTPADCGVDPDDLSCEVRQARNVVRTWREVVASHHPLAAEGFDIVFHTPKYRHAVHTMPVDTDMMAVLFGPFGDMTRRDRRMPFVSEGYVDINPADARDRDLHDGDYVWIDSDPEDRPFRGWRDRPEHYRVARLMCRARYYAGTPRGIARMWFNMYAATPGSVRGAETREDGLAKNPETNYQAMFRYGSHQSVTRGWLKPTLMTDSLVRKGLFGHDMGKGFLPDSHCPTGAPRESIVKITKAEDGGIGGHGRWRPVDLGLRPGSESDALRRFLAGDYARQEG